MKLSSADTEWPSPISRSQKWEPINPAAPEMMKRKSSSVHLARCVWLRPSQSRVRAPALLHSTAHEIPFSWPETVMFLVLFVASRLWLLDAFR